MARKEMTKTVKNSVSAIIKWCDSGIVAIEKEGVYYEPCYSGDGISLASLCVFMIERLAKEINVEFEDVIKLITDIHNGGKFTIVRDENGRAINVKVGD